MHLSQFLLVGFVYGDKAVFIFTFSCCCCSLHYLKRKSRQKTTNTAVIHVVNIQTQDFIRAPTTPPTGTRMRGDIHGLDHIPRDEESINFKSRIVAPKEKKGNVGDETRLCASYLHVMLQEWQRRTWARERVMQPCPWHFFLLHLIFSWNTAMLVLMTSCITRYPSRLVPVRNNLHSWQFVVVNFCENMQSFRS